MSSPSCKLAVRQQESSVEDCPINFVPSAASCDLQRDRSTNIGLAPLSKSRSQVSHVNALTGVSEQQCGGDHADLTSETRLATNPTAGLESCAYG